MKNHLLSLVVALSTGVLLTGCATQEIKLRTHNYIPRDVFSTENSSFSFKSKGEVETAFNDWRGGEVKFGPWQGLKLKTYSLDEKPFLEEVAQNPSPSVKNFIGALKFRYPDFDNLNEIKKAQLIYDTVRSSFKFKTNPYDIIRMGDIPSENLVANPEFVEVRASRDQPYQTVEETFNFGGGICINLSTLLYSMYNYAGINSSLVFQDNCSGNDHVVVAFEAFPKRFLPIDPTRGDLDFTKNIGETQRYMTSGSVRAIELLDPNTKKELLNLTDYL